MIIKCFECGNDVSDKSKVCPKCGVENPKGFLGTGLLRIRRNKAFYGLLVKLSVWIDNNEVGRLGCNELLEIELPEGNHIIEFRQGGKTLSMIAAGLLGGGDAGLLYGIYANTLKDGKTLEIKEHKITYIEFINSRNVEITKYEILEK